FLVYNPPVVDSALGVRASYLKCAERVARDLAAAGVKTLVFARTRQAVEILVRYLRDHGADGARGYRAGYLPNRRREVERSLRAGDAPCVVATSALELGIDVGGLDAVVIAGWPGSRAATWQRAGRAPRPAVGGGAGGLVAPEGPVRRARPGVSVGALPRAGAGRSRQSGDFAAAHQMRGVRAAVRRGRAVRAARPGGHARGARAAGRA